MPTGYKMTDYEYAVAMIAFINERTIRDAARSLNATSGLISGRIQQLEETRGLMFERSETGFQRSRNLTIRGKKFLHSNGFFETKNGRWESFKLDRK